MPKSNLHAHSAICQFRRAFLGLGQLPPRDMALKNDVVFVESESVFRKRDGSTRPLGRPLGIVGNPPSKIIPIVTSKVGIFCQKLIHLDPKKPQRISIPQPKMISKFVPMFFVLLLIAVIISIFGQINGQRAHFIGIE
jgi:hypothetical protein